MESLVTLTKKATLFGVNNSIDVKLFVLFILILFFSCNKPSSPDLFKSTGKIVSEKRLIESFSEVELYNNIHLNLIKDSAEFLVIAAGKNLLSKINVKVKSGVLSIKNYNKFNFIRNYKDSIIIELHYKRLSHLKYYGSGNITTIDTLRETNFAFESWYGSGHSDFKINTEVCSFGFHTGIVDLKVSGFSEENRLYSTEQGLIDCKALDTKKTFCHNRGIADYYIKADEEIGAEIYGEGNIYYQGNAKVSYKYLTATGKLIKGYK